MTFLNVLHSLFIYISLNLPTFEITDSTIVCGYVVAWGLAGLVCSCIIIQLTTVVTWEKALRARVNADNGLWSAVVTCITNNHGKAVGKQWETYNKIKVEKGSNGKFRAVSHGMTISLPDWQWTAK